MVRIDRYVLPAIVPPLQLIDRYVLATLLVACGTGVCWQFAEYTLGENVFETSAGRWITSDCVFTFACVIPPASGP